MEQEIWEDIAGYDGEYRVSSIGRVRNREKVMKLTPQCTGYIIVGLTKNGKQKIYRVHRLVATFFCYKPVGCEIVNHLNGIKTDNRAENLEWTTVSGNTSHSFKMGLQETRKGSDCNFSILSEKDVIKIRERKQNERCSNKTLAIEFNVSRSAISFIVNKKRWAHI